MDALEHMGGGDIGHVERRVLAHQHHVHGRQIETLSRAEVVVIARLAAHLQRPRAGHHPARVERQLAGQIMIQRVAARLGLESQREGAVGVDVDGLDGVHLDGDGETHFRSLIKPAAPGRDRGPAPK